MRIVAEMNNEWMAYKLPIPKPGDKVSLLLRDSKYVPGEIISISRLKHIEGDTSFWKPSLQIVIETQEDFNIKDLEMSKCVRVIDWKDTKVSIKEHGEWNLL